MIRRPFPLLLVLLVVLAACRANVREQTLRATFVGATAAQAGFVAWDKEHQLEIARTARSLEAFKGELDAYHTLRVPVRDAFEATYRAIAAAAIAGKDERSLIDAVRAFERLRVALRNLTKGRVP